MAAPPAGFVTGAGARALLDRFRRALGGPQSRSAREFDADLRALDADLTSRYQLVQAWLTAFLATDDGTLSGYDLPEAVAVELCGTALTRYEATATMSETVVGLLGAHLRWTFGHHAAAGRDAGPHPTVPHRTGAGVPGLPAAA